MVAQRYPLLPSNQTVSYNYTDIADNTGYTSLFAAALSGGNMITSQQIYSIEIQTTGSSTGSDYVKAIDLDFDTSPFNLPRLARGTAIVNVPFATQSTAGSATRTGWVLAKIIHVDGISNAETILGQMSGSVRVSPASAGGINQTVDALKIPITQKKFKGRDVLRLTVEGWVKDNAGVNAIDIAHDPQNRDGRIITPSSAEVTTTLKLDMPFKIQL